ncbi:hypothetical protein [Actinoplanes sp. NPDC051851]|uniref:hypothetical protein n=1 Tax=Actinoplanes sp. NPDC051851 TaxID=3154753 RepID=UPI00341E92ED
MDRSRSLTALGVALLLLPLLWVSFAAAGSQEYVDDDGEIEQTLQAAGVVLLLWALFAGTGSRPLFRSLLVSLSGAVPVLAALCVTLYLGYHAVRPDGVVADPAFRSGALGIAFRALFLALLGTALGYAIGGVARRFSPPRYGLAALGLLLLWAVAEFIGRMIPTGRFQLSTHLVAWVAGDWIIYRPPASCLGQNAATCGMYHATWQRSLPVLATLALAALAVGWSARRFSPAPAAAPTDAG